VTDEMHGQTHIMIFRHVGGKRSQKKSGTRFH
jgi:hypothetical protein